MAVRVERLAEGGHVDDAELAELGEQLAAHQLDAGQDLRVVLELACGADRSVEIIDHVEEAAKQCPRALLELAVRLGGEPAAGGLDLVVGAVRSCAGLLEERSFCCRTAWSCSISASSRAT